jgi:hypothetical protein
VMERGSVWIWESGDPVERSDLDPNNGTNDFDRARAPHYNTRHQDSLISVMALTVINQ